MRGMKQISSHIQWDQKSDTFVMDDMEYIIVTSLQEGSAFHVLYSDGFALHVGTLQMEPAASMLENTDAALRKKLMAMMAMEVATQEAMEDSLFNVK